uniref:IS3 related insertion element n=1 Tax=Corynebacterium glutamicum TaxID=1718 RepID=Q46070_CORGT|nr:unnamed protein product [Corynebacterium glutamicum]
MRSVNTSVIRVKDRPRQASALALSHQQRVLHQGGTHVICDRKAHQPAGIAVNDRSQVHIRPISNRQVRDVPDVHLIWLISGELPADKVRKHCLGFIRHSGGDLAFLCVAKQLQRAHHPSDPLVIYGVMIHLVFEFSGDPLGPITTIFGGEDSLDSSPEDRVGHEAFPAC